MAKNEKKIKVKLSLATNLNRFGVTSGTIVEMGIEEYLKAVVASEIANSHPEACKAQAVASRTFALTRVRSRGYVNDTTADQVFIVTRNDTTRYPNAVQAVIDTKGETLTYANNLLKSCQYGASNGGHTKAYGGYPYLPSKPDPWDLAETERRLRNNEKVRVGNKIGLSQYGARYAAENGVGYREILSFYYPLTEIHPHYGEDDWKEVGGDLATPGNGRTLSNLEKEIVQYVEKQVGNGYVWGSVGQTLTEATLARLLARHAQHINESVVRKWMGKKVFDCAGLLTSIFSNYLNTRVTSGVSSQWKGNHWEIKGDISTIPRNYVVMLYREAPTANPMQHGGLYCGNGMVVDARGSKSGVVKSKLESYPWTHWAVPKGLLSQEDINAIKRSLGVSVTPGGEGNMAETGTARVTGNRVALRPTMTTSSTPITRVATGQIVDLLEKVNLTWWRVRYRAYVGYMMAQYLTELNVPPMEPNATDDAEGGQDEIEDAQYKVTIICDSQDEVDKLLKQLKTAIRS